MQEIAKCRKIKAISETVRLHKLPGTNHRYNKRSKIHTLRTRPDKNLEDFVKFEKELIEAAVIFQLRIDEGLSERDGHDHIRIVLLT